MTTTQITLSEATDKAIEKLPFLRRKTTKFYLRFPKVREAYMDRLRLSLYDDARCMEMFPVASLLTESFTEDTPITMDLDQLERFLQIIIEYLPKILEIILPLFALAAVLFAVTFSGPQPTYAGAPFVVLTEYQEEAEFAPLVLTSVKVRATPVRDFIAAVAAPKKEIAVATPTSSLTTSTTATAIVWPEVVTTPYRAAAVSYSRTPVRVYRSRCASGRCWR